MINDVPILGVVVGSYKRKAVAGRGPKQ